MTPAYQSTGTPTWVKITLAALAGLLVLALALFLVDQREARRQEQLALQRQAELIQEQQAALDKQQEAIAQQQVVIEKQLDTVDSVVDEYEGHIEQQKAAEETAKVLSRQQLKFAHVTSGLSLASSAKVYVAEHYMMEGRVPQSNADVGLPSPESMGGDGVESVAITKDGVIRVTYGSQTGVEGGGLLLSPKANDAAGRIEWTCTTADFPEIEQALPSCRFVG